MNVLRNVFLLIVGLYFLASCRSVGLQHIVIPEIQQCRMLSKSIYCTDDNLDEYKITQIKFLINENQNLNEQQKFELIFYFDDNKEEILESKSYEIGFEYLSFFRGYFLTNAMDEGRLKVFTLEQLKLLEKYMFVYGRFSDKQIKMIESRIKNEKKQH